jgi:hypothetical protein
VLGKIGDERLGHGGALTHEPAEQDEDDEDRAHR